MSLKDALARVTRAAQQMEPLRLARQQLPAQTVAAPAPPQKKRTRCPPRDRLPQNEYTQLRPHLRGFTRRRFQQFLDPLEMPQLKAYDDSLPRYDAKRAAANLAAKKSTNTVDVFHNFLSRRMEFEKMLALLVELTPDHLMSAETVNNPALLASVLEQEHRSYLATRFAQVPRYHFHEVPPLPQDLLKHRFFEYIYYLTHLQILYRNSLSLTSGIVPEILLYTHHLHNDTYKEFRSVESYNCLIKYFGYDKYQNAFARELLLVMAKDGCRPNIDTINQLLKICRVHANRPFLVSTYSVIVSYLMLAKRLDLKVNLSTWNRIYDCIDNIFLKEMFVNKISALNVPLLPNFCIRLLEDFATTTTRNEDVVEFVEQDLRRPNWRTDPRIAEKVLFHKVQHLPANEGLESIWTFVGDIAKDSVTLKTLCNAINANPRLTHKTYLLLATYARFSKDIAAPAEVFAALIRSLCENKENFDHAAVNRILRGIVHIDAVETLALPLESVEYETVETTKKPRSKHFPYAVPQGPISEHYRILKRLTRDWMTEWEGRIIYLMSTEHNHKVPWELPSDAEAQEWRELKTVLQNDPRYWEHTCEKERRLGLVGATREVPSKVVDAYLRQNRANMGLSLNLNIIKKLRVGFDQHTEQQMRERHIC